MSFWSKIVRKRKKGQQPDGSDLAVLDRTVSYAGHLPLPAQDGTASLEAAGTEQGSYLLFFADQTEEGCMNAGYLAGQSVSYLHFLGVESERARVLPEELKVAPPKGMHFVAALAVEGRAAAAKHRRKRTVQESFCICTETRENWRDELLAFTREKYPSTFRRIRVSTKESLIHFAMKHRNGHQAEEEAFEAGIAAANIMTAAEELWVDLEMVKVPTAEPEGYLFSVCRKGDHRFGYA